MEKHPIGELMETTMAKIRELVDVNTIVGQPIETIDGITLIPVSKVSFGFAAGGSEFQTKNGKDGQTNPFGGGSGAGVKIDPIAFLIVKDGVTRMMPVGAPPMTTADRVVELVPQVFDRVEHFIEKKKEEKDIL